jgi:hypothetical protein
MDILIVATAVRVILGFFVVSLAGFAFWLASVVTIPPLSLSELVVTVTPILAFGLGSALVSWAIWLRRDSTLRRTILLLAANIAITLAFTWIGRSYFHAGVLGGSWGGGLPGIHDVAGAWIGAATGSMILPVGRLMATAARHREI